MERASDLPPADVIALAALEACPEAFALVDADLRVFQWNAAAADLTGYSAAQVIGHTLPHLSASQHRRLLQVMPDFDEWAQHVPAVFPRRHADGRTIEVCVTRYVRLSDDDGGLLGFGSFFRAARPNDSRTHARNVFSLQLARSLRPQDALEALHEIITEFLPGERGYLLRRRDQGWCGWLAAGDHQEVAEGMLPRDPEPFDTAVAKGICVQTSMDVAGTDTPVIVVPVGSSGASTVLILAPADRDLFGEEEELVIALASEAWASLRRVEVIDELEGKVEILEAIAGVSSAAGLEWKEVVDHITSHAAAALSCERAALYLWDDDHQSMKLVSFHAADRDWPIEHDLHETGQAAAREMLDSIEPFLTQDAQTCAWLSGPWDHDQGAVSVHGMPLRVGEEELGVLVVAHTTANPRGFTSLCTQVGQALSRQAALAITNARLFSAQRQAAISFKQLDQQRADWVAGITHDLRSPVTAILGFGKTLEQMDDRMTPADRTEAVAVIVRQALRVSRMLDDMMDSARAEAGVLGTDGHVAVSLQRTVRDAVLVCTPEERERLQIQVDTDVTVRGNSSQLARVVQNLVVNALNHAPDDTTVQVRAFGTPEEGVIVVTDHGPGIPDGVHLFDRYSRGSPGGVGLGLYTASQIVKLHHGSIDVDDTPGGGATFLVRLPLSGGALDNGVAP